APSTITVKENDTILLNYTINDADGDTITTQISGYMHSAEKQTGFDDAGMYTVTISAADGLLTTEKNIQIVIENTNRQPQISELPNITANVGDIIPLQPQATDPDNQNTPTNDDNNLTFYYSSLFDENGTYTTTAYDIGANEITYGVSDGELFDENTLMLFVFGQPAEISGTVTLYGLPAEDGILVNATIDNTTYATATTDGGRYTLTIPADDPTTAQKDGARENNLIVFYVENIVAPETVIWHTNTLLQQDLTIGQPYALPIISEQSVSPNVSGIGLPVTIAATVTDEDGDVIAVTATLTKLDGTTATYSLENSAGDQWNAQLIQYQPGRYNYTLLAKDSHNLNSTASGSLELQVNLTISVATDKTSYVGDEYIKLSEGVSQNQAQSTTITETTIAFEGGNSEENLTFTPAQNNIMRYITLPLNANISTASLTLRGFPQPDYPQPSLKLGLPDGIYDWQLTPLLEDDVEELYRCINSCDCSAAVDENWDSSITGCAGFPAVSAGVYENNTIPQNTQSAEFVVKYACMNVDANDAFFYWDYSLNQWIALSMPPCDINPTIATIPLPDSALRDSTLQMKLLAQASNLEYTRWLYEGKILWNVSTMLTESPVTADFRVPLQNIVDANCTCDGCSVQENRCRIPMTFHSETEGIAEYSQVTITYNHEVPPVNSQELMDNVILLHHLDINAAVVPDDAPLHQWNGTVTRALFTPSCKIGGCYDFTQNTASDTVAPVAYIRAGNQSFWDPGYGDFMVAAWVKLEGENAQQIIFGEGTGDTPDWIFLTDNNNGVRLFVRVDQGAKQYQNAVGSTPLNDGNWHFLVGGREGNRSFVYADNILEDVDERGASPLYLANDDPAYIGANNNLHEKGFDGYIDELVVFNTTFLGRTAEVVDYLWNNGTGRSIGKTPMNASSFIVNNGPYAASFYRTLKVQYWDGTAWDDEAVIYQDTSPLQLAPGEQEELAPLWNQNSWLTSLSGRSSGEYRAYIAVTDENGKEISNDHVPLTSSTLFSVDLTALGCDGDGDTYNRYEEGICAGLDCNDNNEEINPGTGFCVERTITRQLIPGWNAVSLELADGMRPSELLALY
ncbi:LamG domain-containing protein, partial [Candidatus Woesearchaeota archaeon]|nr:LamG domain-containing protein [Candidatus Woesearchaeota archaeon]